VTHRGPLKSGPGEIGRAIAFDGMVIEPGDLIIGDGDGLLCIRFDEVEEVYAASAKKKAEDKILADLKGGGSTGRAWVDATLKQLGCKCRGEQRFGRAAVVRDPPRHRSRMPLPTPPENAARFAADAKEDQGCD
jgi:hypothetical protein